MAQEIGKDKGGVDVRLDWVEGSVMLSAPFADAQPFSSLCEPSSFFSVTAWISGMEWGEGERHGCRRPWDHPISQAV